MKLVLYILEQIIINFINNIMLSSILNIEISNLILFNGISMLIYLILNNNNILPIYLEKNILFIPIILMLYNFNYKYNFIFSGFMFLGIAFYLFSIYLNNINLIKINLIFPKSIIITNIILIIFEFFKILYKIFFLNIKNNNNLLNIIIILTTLILIIFKYLFKNIKIEIFTIFSILINYIISKSFKINIFDNKRLQIFKLPFIYKYNFNIKSIIFIFPIIIILLIEHISYITILNLNKNNYIKFIEQLKKSFFSNSIIIIISSLFGSIPNTLSENNINNKILYNNKTIKITQIFLSILFIILSFINRIFYIKYIIPISFIYGIYLYIYINILLSCFNILIKNINIKDILIIIISLIVYILNFNNIYKISLSLFCSIIFNIIFIYLFKEKKFYSYK